MGHDYTGMVYIKYPADGCTIQIEGWPLNDERRILEALKRAAAANDTERVIKLADALALVREGMRKAHEAGLEDATIVYDCSGVTWECWDEDQALE